MVDLTTEPPLPTDNGMVSITFSATDGVYHMTDAIVLRQDQFAGLTQSDIIDEQLRRWNEWIAIVVPPEEPVDG